MFDVIAIPALSDNYIWIITPASIQAGDPVAIVDPGEAGPVMDWLSHKQLRIGAVIATHHHPDHTAGINDLLAWEKQNSGKVIPVYGSKADQGRVKQISHPLSDGDNASLDWLDLTFSTIEVPGHTLGHIALHAPGLVLAGDTLFRAGCGRVFEGTPTQMQQALARLRALDDNTRVYAGHEYTQKNLAFARKVEPDNPDIARVTAEVNAARDQDKPSLPGTIGEERRINPFLRWDTPDVARAASQRAGRKLSEPAEIFAELRSWKDAS